MTKRWAVAALAAAISAGCASTPATQPQSAAVEIINARVSQSIAEIRQLLQGK